MGVDSTTRDHGAGSSTGDRVADLCATVES
jgi:hypothetical protein